MDFDDADDDEVMLPAGGGLKRVKRKGRGRAEIFAAATAAVTAGWSGRKGRGKRARVSADADGGPSWVCPSCTVCNSGSAGVCCVCEAERPAGDAAVVARSESTSGWTCARCTMRSHDDMARCVACHAPRGDSVIDLSAGSSSAAAAAAAFARPEPPKLHENRVFLAGLEESLGSIHISPQLQKLVARSIQPQWSLLESKLKDLSEKDFPQRFVLGAQKSLVHEGCMRALKLRDTMQLLMDVAQLETDSLEAAECVQCCGSGTSTELIWCTDACTHALCLRCAKKLILRLMAEKQCLSMRCPFDGCNEELAARSVRRALTRQEFNEYSDLCFQLSTSNSDLFQRCPVASCSALTEIVSLTSNLRVPKGGITQTDESGKVLSEASWRHFQEFRLRCRECGTNFCTACRSVPYHLGHTCSEHREYATSRHCRCCTEQLKPGSTDDSMPNGLAVCTAEHCQQMKARSCTHKLECGHACYGVRGEKEHPPCLEEDCPAASDKCDGSENCAICYVEELRHAGPVVQLSSCGHVYHEACVLEKIRKRWAGQRITFGFLDCSKCKTRMNHPSPAIRAALEPIEKLYQEVSAKATARLAIEGMTKDAKLVTPGSQFFNKPEAYALASFAYYNCFKCRKFYFGGRRDCEQNAAAEVRPEEEFVCFDCAPVKATACKSKAHREFHLWKCRFCCHPAVWFCGGTHHYCDKCHSGAYSGATKKCPGPARCPLKMVHPPNGSGVESEFNIGCGICQEKLADTLAARKKEEAVNEEIEKEAAKAATAKARA